MERIWAPVRPVAPNMRVGEGEAIVLDVSVVWWAGEDSKPGYRRRDGMSSDEKLGSTRSDAGGSVRRCGGWRSRKGLDYSRSMMAAIVGSAKGFWVSGFLGFEGQMEC